jgi:hypothetical protein
LLFRLAGEFCPLGKGRKKQVENLSTWFKRSGAFKWAKRHRFTEPHFEPYVKAIGQLLLAWNDLHERLAALFVTAMGGGWVDRHLAVWHSITSDRSKRRALREAIVKLPESEKAGRNKLVDEITWVLKETDKLGELRNVSAHTPLQFSEGDLFAIADLFSVTDLFSAGSRVFPDTSFQNPRAARLDQKNKDLLIEYKYARERILVLRDYVIAIDTAWSNASLPWPERPSLPERRPRKARRPIVKSKDRS